jgi:segregation and condensation protein B
MEELEIDPQSSHPEPEAAPTPESAQEHAPAHEPESLSQPETVPESPSAQEPEPAQESESVEQAPQDPEPPQDPEAEEPASERAPGTTISIEEWMAATDATDTATEPTESIEDAQLLAVLEACVYVAEEPLMPAQIAAALNQDVDRVRRLLTQLVKEFERPEHGINIREVAGGFQMTTKAEHHDAVRNFVKSLKAPLKLSLPALETLAVIAYKQPVTTPEIMEIRGVQGGSVLRTLLDRKLITEAGRKNVIGKPILYKTTKEFLIQFGLKDIAELPSLKEFEEIRRMAMSDTEPAPEAAAESKGDLSAVPRPPAEPAPEPEAAAAEPEPPADHAESPAEPVVPPAESQEP